MLVVSVTSSGALVPRITWVAFFFLMHIPGPPKAKPIDSDSLEGIVNSSFGLNGHRGWVVSRAINRFDGLPPSLPLPLEKAAC